MDSWETLVQLALAVGAVVALLAAWEVDRGNRKMRDARRRRHKGEAD